MWQTKYASAVSKYLGLGFDFRLCSKGDFLNGRPQSVGSTTLHLGSSSLKNWHLQKTKRENQNVDNMIKIGKMTCTLCLCLVILCCESILCQFCTYSEPIYSGLQSLGMLCNAETIKKSLCNVMSFTFTSALESNSTVFF